MIKKTTIIFGVFLIVFGLVGFLPNPLVGRHAFFVSNSFQNFLNMFFGIVLAYSSFRPVAVAAKALKAAGYIFMALAILGFFSEEKIMWLLSSNIPSSWLYLALSFALLFYCEKFSATAKTLA